MRGLEKRKGSNNWQGRFRIPKHLWDRRDELARLGVKDISGTQEFKKSLGTPNQREAERLYRDMQTQWDAKMEVWEALLRDGPVGLTHLDAVALAGHDALAFVELHKADPQKTPGPRKLIAAQIDNLRWARSQESLQAGQAIFEVGQELEAIPIVELPVHIATGLGTEPDASRREALMAAASAMLNYREMLGRLRAKKIADDHGIALTKDSRKLLASHRAGYHEDVWQTLRANLHRDYSEPQWVKGLPPLGDAPVLKAKSAQSESASRAIGRSLLDMVDGWAEFEGVKPATARQNRAMVQKLIAFVGHDDPERLTKDDVRRWRDAMKDEGRLAAKTINDRYLAALRAVLSYAVTEHDLPDNVAAGVRDSRDSSPPKGQRGYTDEQALTILRATFGGSRRGLGPHHRRALFWVPWILAFTGLRVSEVTQLQGRHVREEGGVWYLRITPEDGSTKGNNAWNVAIHRQLLGLGVVEMVKAAGDGPLFYEPYPAGTDLTALTGTHRAKYSATRIGDWIKNEVGIAAPIGRPNHAWRHRFTTLSRTWELNKEARDYMLGSQPKNDAREGYGEWLPADLAREIEKLPDVDVEDTGWRP